MLKRLAGLLLCAGFLFAGPAVADDEDKVQDYLEGTCGLAGDGKGSDGHEDCMVEERASFEENLSAMRADFEEACEGHDQGSDERQACLQEQGDELAAHFRERVEAIEEDSMARDLPDFHERLANLCTSVLRQAPDTPSHDYCIAQHAIQYSYFAQAVLQELDDDPVLGGY